MLKQSHAPGRPARRPELFKHRHGFVRPLAVAGAVCFACLYFLIEYPALLSVLCLIGAAGVLVCALLLRRLHAVRALTASALVIVCCLLFAGEEYFSLRPAVALAGKRAQVTAHTENSAEQRYGKYEYLFVTDSVNGEKFKSTVRFESYTPLEIEPYDAIEMTAVLELAGNNRDSNRYYRSKGIYLEAYELQMESVTPGDGLRPLGYYIWRFREGLSAQISTMMGADTGGLLRGILLGDKTGLSWDISHDFQLIGISHILSVSGLHMSVWAMAALSLLKRARVGPRASVLLAGGFVLFFMALTGFTPSVMRSGIMMLLYLSSFLFKRTPDSLNSLGGAVLILLAVNPLAAADVGLTMSVLATFGIITLHTRLSKWYGERLDRIAFSPVRRLFKGVLDVFSISVCATLFTMPTVLVEFGMINVLSPLSNLFIAGLATPAMILGGIGAAFGMMGALFLTQPLSVCSGTLLRLMIRMSGAFADIPYVSYYVPSGSALRLLMFLIVTAAVFWLLTRERVLLPAVAYILALAVAVTACIGVPAYQDRGRAVIHIAQGSNPCVLIRNGGQTVLIGSGRDGSGFDLLERNNLYRVDFLYFWSDDSETDERAVLRRCRDVQPVFQGEAFRAAFAEGMELTSDGESLLLQVNGRTVRIAENLKADPADILVAGGFSAKIDYADVLAVETNARYAKGRNTLTVPYNGDIIIRIDDHSQIVLDGGS